MKHMDDIFEWIVTFSVSPRHIGIYFKGCGPAKIGHVFASTRWVFIRTLHPLIHIILTLSLVLSCHCLIWQIATPPPIFPLLPSPHVSLNSQSLSAIENKSFSISDHLLTGSQFHQQYIIELPLLPTENLSMVKIFSSEPFLWQLFCILAKQWENWSRSIPGLLENTYKIYM